MLLFFNQLTDVSVLESSHIIGSIPTHQCGVSQRPETCDDQLLLLGRNTSEDFDMGQQFVEQRLLLLKTEKPFPSQAEIVLGDQLVILLVLFVQFALDEHGKSLGLIHTFPDKILIPDFGQNHGRFGFHEPQLSRDMAGRQGVVARDHHDVMRSVHNFSDHRLRILLQRARDNDKSGKGQILF